MVIRAVFEKGVFRPIEKVNLPDSCEVEVEFREIYPETQKQTKPTLSEGLAKIYAILGERYDSGFTDTAERHNEHQP